MYIKRVDILKFLYISGFHKKNGIEPNFNSKPKIKIIK